MIRRAILWNDQRTSAECREMEERVGGRKKLIKLVANPAMTGFTAPKILWLRNHEPQALRADPQGAAAEGRNPPPHDRRVCHRGERRQRHAAVGRGQARLVEEAALGPGTRHRPARPAATSRRTSPGGSRPQAAEALGLSTDCVVVGGAGDCAAGAVGNGIVSKGVLSTSIGTSGVMFVHSDEVKIDPEGRIHTFCHAVRGKWHMMGVNLSAGGSLQWFRNELCKADAAEAKRCNKEVYEVLTAEAQTVPAGSQGLFFLPYLSGERTPHADPDARGCFVGLTLAHTRGHLIRAIMEGVTYSMRDSLEIIEGLGVPVRQIRASGGGSRSPLWRQIQADVFGRKVVTINSEEGAAYGVALLAAVGAGAFKNISEACDAAIRVVQETAPNQPAKNSYDRAFPIYQQLYRSLKKDFKSIAALEG